MRTIVTSWMVVMLAVPWAAAGEPDAWIGKTRAEVFDALGRPSQTKARGEGETLIYRFFRLREGSPPSTRMVAVEVPEVGVVYRVLEGRPAEREFEPTTIDREGRTIAGGVREGVGGSATYDSDRKRFERDWDPDDKVEVEGKVKLRLRLDSNGRIVEWDVSPKRARRDSRDS